MSPVIRTIGQADWAAWEPLFKAYIDFYQTSIPTEQYQKTFDRLVDPQTDLYGLVMTDEQDQSKLLAIAHYFPRQTPWSEKKVMHLNGPFSLAFLDLQHELIQDLFVSPDARSKGYGRMMIQAVEKHARDMDCLHLGWATNHGNPARKLYDQMGKCDFVEYRIKF